MPTSLTEVGPEGKHDAEIVVGQRIRDSAPRGNRRGWRYDDRTMDSNVGAYSPIRLRVEASLAPRLAELSEGRVLVIDYFASRTRRGVTVGDLRVTFGAIRAGSDYAEL